MNKPITIDTFGTFTEPAKLTMQRILPGPIERVWSYLTDSNLRRQWLASGEMEMTIGSEFEFVWRNSELSNPPGVAPVGFGEVHRMASRLTACNAPHELAFTWGANGNVAITLQSQGRNVLLTLIHERISDNTMKVMVGAGWHAHLDILAERISGQETTTSFWDSWANLKPHYEMQALA